jgi:thiamine-monophosphate kinase
LLNIKDVHYVTMFASGRKQSEGPVFDFLCLTGPGLSHPGATLRFVRLPERKLIEHIRRMSGQPTLKGHGIGDDCAVIDLPRGHEALITTDFSLENVHFKREWHPADSVGWRCLARGLSDIAAMGGEPRAAFLSLALPPDVDQLWVGEFLWGFLQLAELHGLPLAGGDTAQSPEGILADIIMLGSVPKGKAVLRSGAHVGDLIYVTGLLGQSAITLQLLRSGEMLRATRAHRRHFYPEPRIQVGRYLREKKLASAMIDTSDGLSVDLQHICEESGVGAVVYAESLPRLPGRKGLELALHGGEDYELLFTAAPGKRVPKLIGGVSTTLIGEIVRGGSVRLATRKGALVPLEVKGWQHFVD